MKGLCSLCWTCHWYRKPSMRSHRLNLSLLWFNLVKWFVAYLRGRKVTCLHKLCVSPSRYVRAAGTVPQGSVISHTLYKPPLSRIALLLTLTWRFTPTTSRCRLLLPKSLPRRPVWHFWRQIPSSACFSLLQVRVGGDVVSLNRYSKILST